MPPKATLLLNLVHLGLIFVGLIIALRVILSWNKINFTVLGSKIFLKKEVMKKLWLSVIIAASFYSVDVINSFLIELDIFILPSVLAEFFKLLGIGVFVYTGYFISTYYLSARE